MSNDSARPEHGDDPESGAIPQERAEEIVSELLKKIEEHQGNAEKLDGERAAAEYGMADGMMHAVNLINNEIYDEKDKI